MAMGVFCVIMIFVVAAFGCFMTEANFRYNNKNIMIATVVACVFLAACLGYKFGSIVSDKIITEHHEYEKRIEMYETQYGTVTDEVEVK